MQRSIPPKQSIPKEEQGLTMVLALFLGLILIAGVSGLMLRQLMARKLGSSESYQQMAENAAINGFNRILGEVNRDSETNYKGYFLTLRNDADGWGWRNPNSGDYPLVELCTYTGLSLTADPLGGADDPNLPAPTVPLNTVPLPRSDEEIQTHRADGKGDIQLFYRLRGYALAGDGTSNDEGTFQIEGIVKRQADADDDTKYLARTLLTRSLYIDQRVAGEGDWAVMAGYHMRLGDAEIEGKGKILLDVTEEEAEAFQMSNGCRKNNLLQSVGSTNDDEDFWPRIWPVMERGLPTLSLFEKGNAKDMMSSSSSKIRVWSFDDSDPSNSLDRCGEVACVRREDRDSFDDPPGVDQDNARIVIEQDDICDGSSSFECHMYIEHMNLNNTEVLIETGSSSKPRPVVIHLELPKSSSKIISNLSGNIKLSGDSLFCGVNNGQRQCNGKPERFVIAASAGTDGLSCDATAHVLDFTGDTLPHAFIHLRKGTVKPAADATLHGVIWAQNICTKDVQFTLNTSDSNETVVRAANTLWQWGEQGFPGYGQMVVRGIRGTGLDTFRRW